MNGFTGLFENNKWKKFVLLEGHGTVTFPGINDPCRIEDGQMMIWWKHPTRCPEVHTVDVAKIVKSAKLVTLSKLPPWSWDAIQLVIDNQTGNPPPGGFTDPTGHDNVDQKNSGQPPPRIIRPPGSPPGSF